MWRDPFTGLCALRIKPGCIQSNTRSVASMLRFSINAAERIVAVGLAMP
jgi:hypothetical protein